MNKEFCRYAIWDVATGALLVCGEKYKVNVGLNYVESFRGFTHDSKKYTPTLVMPLLKVVMWILFIGLIRLTYPISRG